MNERAEIPEEIRRLIARLGDAINASVSNSQDVADSIRRIQDEGFQIYVVLDARIGVDRDRRQAYQAARRGLPDGGNGESVAEPGNAGRAGSTRTRLVVAAPGNPVEFRMNIADARFLRNLGIDGTLRIRPARVIRSASLAERPQSGS